MKNLIRIIVALIIVVAILFILSSITENAMNQEEQRILSLLNTYELNIPEVFEYSNDIINLDDYVTYDNPSEIVEDTKENKQSLTEVGIHNISLNIVATDKYGRKYEKILSQKYEIKDTNPPIIELTTDEVIITEGDKLDLTEIVSSIYDIVDGELEYSDIPNFNCYWFENVPKNNPGNYVVTIVACDKNNLITTTDIKVTIKDRVVYNNTVNFDKIFSVKTHADGEVQTLLDKGYIVYYCSDYFHHNTSKFLNLFWKCTRGIKVIINGITYTSGGIYHGYVYEHKIYYDNGSLSWYDNNATELITCAEGKDKRWILILY